MALHDRPARPDRGTPEFASTMVRRSVGQALGQAKTTLTRMKNLYDQHGQDLIDALGDDGAEFAPNYAAIKTMVEALDDTYTVPDLA